MKQDKVLLRVGNVSVVLCSDKVLGLWIYSEGIGIGYGFGLVNIRWI